MTDPLFPSTTLFRFACLVVDRDADLLVVEFFSAGMFRHREWIYDALRAQFPGCRFHAFADEHVQKQESFDFKPWNSEGTQASAPAIITEHGVKFRADPAGAHKTGFFRSEEHTSELQSLMRSSYAVFCLK